MVSKMDTRLLAIQNRDDCVMERAQGATTPDPEPSLDSNRNNADSVSLPAASWHHYVCEFLYIM